METITGEALAEALDQREEAMIESADRRLALRDRLLAAMPEVEDAEEFAKKCVLVATMMAGNDPHYAALLGYLAGLEVGRELERRV